MCLKPIKIRNRSLTVGQSDWTPYNLTVPCMECAECKSLIRDQWYLRAFWQARYTFDQNGYVLFDTLTYDEQSLPHISDFVPELKNSILDFPCFSQDHYRRFFIDLRQNLSRAGFDVKDHLKYFMCSEYGSQTHRPHYHILLYVTDPRLSPEVLSQAVSKSWKYGRTDGVPYKSFGYVLGSRVFGPRFNDDRTAVQAASGYVMKYITKDSDFENRIKSRLNILMDRYVSSHFPDLSFEHWYDAPGVKDHYREIKRYISQFHRQSQHFGEYALSQYDIDEVMKAGTMSLPDPDSVVKYIPLPMYYSRKLFCTQVKLDDGRRVWVPTELGKKYRYRRTYMSAAWYCRRLQDWERNIDTQFLDTNTVFRLPDGSEFQFDSESLLQARKALRSEIYRLLAGRSLLDVATYAMFYRGRVIPRENLIDPERPSTYDVVSMQLSSDPRHTENVYRLKKYIDNITGEEVEYMSLVPDNMFNSAVEARRSGRSMDVDVISVNVFKRNMLVTDSTFDEYRGFDDIIDLYEMCMRFVNRKKQDVFDVKERTEKILKFFSKS